MRVIDGVVKLDMVRLVDGRRLRDCKGIKRRTNSATVTLGGGVGGTHGDHITSCVVVLSGLFTISVDKGVFLVVNLQFWLVCRQRCFD